MKNRKWIYLFCLTIGLFFQNSLGVCSENYASKKEDDKYRPLEVKSYSKDDEISNMNFTHASSSDTSLGYLTQGGGYNGSQDPLNFAQNISGIGGKVLDMLGKLGMLQQFMALKDALQFFSGGTVGCAVLELTRTPILTEELDVDTNKMVEYLNLKNTTEDVMLAWGEENTNAVMNILRDAADMSKDYLDLIDLENTPVGEQVVYGKPQSSIAAARQYVKDTFFYDAEDKGPLDPVTGLVSGRKSLDEIDREVDKRRRVYVNEVILNSLGAAYAYSSFGVEESGNREKDLVERIINAKNWDEMRAAEALADLNVTREQIVNLSLQMRLLELMAVDKTLEKRRAWSVPLSPEEKEKQTRERLGK